MEDNSTIRELRTEIVRLQRDKNDLLEAVMGLLSGIGQGGYIPSCGYVKTKKAQDAVTKVILRGN